MDKNIAQTIRDAREVIDLAKVVCGKVIELQGEHGYSMAKMTLVMGTATYIMLRTRYPNRFEALKEYHEVASISSELVEQLISAQVKKDGQDQG